MSYIMIRMSKRSKKKVTYVMVRDGLNQKTKCMTVHGKRYLQVFRDLQRFLETEGVGRKTDAA